MIIIITKQKPYGSHYYIRGFGGLCKHGYIKEKAMKKSGKNNGLQTHIFKTRIQDETTPLVHYFIKILINLAVRQT